MIIDRVAKIILKTRLLTFEAVFMPIGAKIRTQSSVGRSISQTT